MITMSVNNVQQEALFLYYVLQQLVLCEYFNWTKIQSMSSVIWLKLSVFCHHAFFKDTKLYLWSLFLSLDCIWCFLELIWNHRNRSLPARGSQIFDRYCEYIAPCKWNLARAARQYIPSYWCPVETFELESRTDMHSQHLSLFPSFIWSLISTLFNNFFLRFGSVR